MIRQFFSFSFVLFCVLSFDCFHFVSFHFWVIRFISVRLKFVYFLTQMEIDSWKGWHAHITYWLIWSLYEIRNIENQNKNKNKTKQKKKTTKMIEPNAFISLAFWILDVGVSCRLPRRGLYQFYQFHYFIWMDRHLMFLLELQATDQFEFQFWQLFILW